MILADRQVPELQSFSPGQYDIVFYALVVTAFALFASFLYSWTSRDGISARYRPAIQASLCITAVATVSYVVLIIKWDTGYALTAGRYVPGPEALLTIVPRYMDWTVTVPLLTAELIAVTTVVGTRARSLRATTMTAGFLMIITGFIGAKVVDEGTDVTALVVWGAISTVFYVYLYVALIGAVSTSVRELPAAAGQTLRNAAILLLSVFGVYPLVYAVPVFFDTSASWTTAVQLAFSAADITAKVGFGALIHKVAKLRTAADVLAGEDTNPEPIWISGTKASDGLQPALRVHPYEDRRQDGGGRHEVGAVTTADRRLDPVDGSSRRSDGATTLDGS